MKILIATVQVPFVRGGAEALVEGLTRALRAEGHEAEALSVPFKWYPPERMLDQMLACRLLDVSEAAGAKVDLLIGVRFPAYLVPHPNKVLWLAHQHRPAYDLWGHPLGDLHAYPNGAQVRAAIRHADREFIAEAKRIFTISRNVSDRLKTFSGFDSTPLHHPPPQAEEFYRAEASDYLFFPSRVDAIKRQSLVVEALARTGSPVRVLFAGASSTPTSLADARALASSLGVGGRVEWLGEVSEEEKRELYARSLGVVYTPFDEDYGYVSLEAMLAAKPVVTCADSGGALEFVRHGETGLVAEPTPEALASALDELWSGRSRAARMGEAARSLYEDSGISWSRVTRALLR